MSTERPVQFVAYFALGVLLGALFVMSEVASWFRIYEMFRFESIHMFGVIGVAVTVAAISLQVIRRFNVRTLDGEPIVVAPKEWGETGRRGARYWLGGTIFGLGWALIGACPGPMYALLGSGVSVFAVAIAAAMLGTWMYGVVQHRLPH